MATHRRRVITPNGSQYLILLNKQVNRVDTDGKYDSNHLFRLEHLCTLNYLTDNTIVVCDRV